MRLPILVTGFPLEKPVLKSFIENGPTRNQRNQHKDDKIARKDKRRIGHRNHVALNRESEAQHHVEIIPAIFTALHRQLGVISADGMRASLRLEGIIFRHLRCLSLATSVKSADAIRKGRRKTIGFDLNQSRLYSEVLFFETMKGVPKTIGAISIVALTVVVLEGVSAQAAMADCPSSLMTPRIQAAAQRIIEVYKQGRLDDYYDARETPEYLANVVTYRQIAERLRRELTYTRQEVLDTQKDPRIRDIARHDPRYRELLDRNASEYPDKINYAEVDKVLGDRATVVTCFPDLGPFLQLAREFYETKQRKDNQAAADAATAAAEAKKPIGFLRQTYRVYIALQRCRAAQDYNGPLVNDYDLARAKEAARRAEQRLVPNLDSGVTKDQVWEQAAAMPPVEGSISSRYTCAAMLSELLQANPVPFAVQKP